jgi:hypothetical protein
MATNESAQTFSWIVNWMLLVMKLVVSVMSGSKVVWAAFAGNNYDTIYGAVLTYHVRLCC